MSTSTVPENMTVITEHNNLAAGMTCPACGAMNASSAKYCADCGSAMDAMDTVNNEDAIYSWRGVLGVEGSPTADKRLLMVDKIGQRDLPLPFRVQLQSADGHDGSPQAGRIETIERIPVPEFDQEGFDLSHLPENAVVIWATGALNGDHADTAKQYLENGAGVSLDLPTDEKAILDPETYQEIDATEADPFDLLAGNYLLGIGGKIAGATIVDIAAFEEARVEIVPDRVLVASAGFIVELIDSKDSARWVYVGPEGEDFQPRVLVAAAGPVKPPQSWFEDPRLRELTPLTIEKSGRVFGHLADWSGCHTGFTGMCVRPYRSTSNYAYFNVGEIETAEGELVPCGKIMFSMTGAGHAPVDSDIGYAQIMRYYDDATHVGAFVRAGSDRFGTWLAGTLRSNLSELEVQHLRTHPPSGDWRPIPGRGSELIAAFSVPIPGFPIARGHALVASAGGEIAAIISAPLVLSEEDGHRSRIRRKRMLTARVREALGMKEKTRAEIRREALEYGNGPYLDDFDTQEFAPEEFAPTAEQRRQWARQGIAMKDGSYPITKCSGSGTSAENAIRSQGRGQTPGSQAAVVAHTKTRVRALGCSGGIFDDYQ